MATIKDFFFLLYIDRRNEARIGDEVKTSSAEQKDNHHCSPLPLTFT